MKKLTFIYCLLILNISFSQNLFKYDIVNTTIFDEVANSQKDKIKNVTKIQTFNTNQEGQNILIKESLLDSSSSTVSQFSYLNKKIINYSCLSEYANRTILERSYGKRNYKTVYDFVTLDSSKKFIDQKRIYVNNKLSSTSKMYRQKNGKIDSIYFYSKQKETPNSTLHIFYKNDAVLETKLYRKGKLSSIQKYNCNPIGEDIKKVKQTQKCLNTEIDSNGNKIEVYIITNDKGEEEKSKVTISKTTNKTIKSERFNTKNIRTFYWEDSGSSRTSTNYNSRGKETFKIIYFYDKNNRIIKKENFWKEKLKFRTEYSYNNLGLIGTSISTNSKEKRTSYLYKYL